MGLETPGKPLLQKGLCMMFIGCLNNNKNLDTSPVCVHHRKNVGQRLKVVE